MTSPTDTIMRKSGRFFSRTFKLLMRLSVIFVFVGAGLFVGGFLKFSNTVTSYEVKQDIAKADGIVVVTGGSDRIAKALAILEEGKGKRLLISGVNPSTQTSQLQTMNPEHSALFDCCVEIERKAADTIGNAEETKKWNEVQKHESMILVTSGYHMPRCLLEFQRAMPDVKFVGYPVPLKELQSDDWWQRSGTLRLMVFEYLKYIGAWSRNYVTPSAVQAVKSSLFQ